MATNVSDDIGALYQALKQYVGQVRRDNRLPVPPAESVTVHSPRCGSQLTLDARIRGGRVYAIGYRVRACSLGQATTAIVAEHAPGLDARAVQRIGDQLRAILAGRAAHCDWPELEVFALARDIPARHGSAMLPFDALHQLFARIDAGIGSPATESDVSVRHRGAIEPWPSRTSSSLAAASAAP